jgi:hypothetical protein
MLGNDNQNITKKSYWDRPDGKVGIIAGIFLAGYAGLKLLPILTAIVWNTINFGIACGVGFALFMLVSNRKFRLSVGYLYEIFFKALTGFVIQLDPFIIAESYIQDMEKEQRNLKNKIVEILGQKENLTDTLNKNKKQISRKESEYQLGVERNDRVLIETSQVEIGELISFNDSITLILNDIIVVSEQLQQLDENATIAIKNAKTTLNNTKIKYDTLLKGNSALKSALSIINGDPDKKQMLEMSAEQLQITMSNQLAQMKLGIKEGEKHLKQAALNRAIDAKEGEKYMQQRLQEKNNNSISMNQLTSKVSNPIKNTSTDNKTYDKFDEL